MNKYLNTYHLLGSLNRCYKCFPFDGKEEKHQCIRTVLNDILYKVLPSVITNIIVNYAKDDISEDFLMQPLHPSWGVINCQVIRSKDQEYNLFLEYPSILSNSFPKSINSTEKSDEKTKIDLIFDNIVDSMTKVEKKSSYEVALFHATEGKPIKLFNAKNRIFALTYDISYDNKVLGNIIRYNIRGASFGIYHNNIEIGAIDYSHFYKQSGSPLKLQVAFRNSKFKPINSKWSKIKKYFIHEKNILKKLKEFQNNKYDDEELKKNLSSLDLNKTNFNHMQFETLNSDIELYHNLRPTWNDRLRSYVLNFDNQRVTEKSIKNFKLVKDLDLEKHTILQFGRTKKRDIYIMDVQYPLSIMQAFSICMSSIISKN